MVNNPSQGGAYIISSVLLAMILMLVPLPDSLRFIRPEWVVMVLIYWAMALPQRVGVGVAWFTGLFMDVLMGGALGIVAFSYASVIYLVLRFHLQLRQYPLWQQAFSILSLVLLVNIIAVMFTARTIDLTFWLPAVVSTLFWPVVYSVLRAVRRSFYVS